jgi:formate dehydrogenase maturation protein FdhE
LRGARGGPGDFERRYTRATTIEPTPGTAEPLALLIGVLDHQRARASSPEVRSAAAGISARSGARRLGGRFPLLDLHEATEPVLLELEIVTAPQRWAAQSLPVPLDEARRQIAELFSAERRSLVQASLTDDSGVDPRIRFWLRVAAAPVLEGGAARVEPPDKSQWSIASCPACGAAPQVSVIIEESGEFMAGSPRYLVCARCALWWPFARATCVSCGEDDSRLLGSYVAEGQQWVRVDVCDVCRVYVKSFDLREPGSREVVPLVDDVATLTLDIWAHDQGCRRPSVSLAGV